MVGSKNNNLDGLAVLRGKPLIDHGAGRLDAVDAWHAHVHEDHRRALVAGLDNSILTISGFSDDGDVFLGATNNARPARASGWSSTTTTRKFLPTIRTSRLPSAEENLELVEVGDRQSSGHERS